MLHTLFITIVIVGVSMLLMYFGRSKINPHGCGKWCEKKEDEDEKETKE